MNQLEVLKFAHPQGDYEVLVRTDGIGTSWENFKGRLRYRNEYLPDEERVEVREYCDYASSDGCAITLYDPDDGSIATRDGGKKWPVVFETNQYQIVIKFHGLDKESTPKVVHLNKAVEDAFYLDADEHDRGEQRLTGSVDFLNEPGLFKLSIEYSKGGRSRSAWVAFDVVSPKLDVKHDYKKMLCDVNEEFDDIVFNYLSTTFQQFGRGKEKNLEVWMSVFEAVANDYLKSVERIIKSPHSKARTQRYYAKADKIVRWTREMEEEYKEIEAEGNLEKHYFGYDSYENTVNTFENRFVKYTLKHIGERLKQVFATKLRSNEVSENALQRWKEYQQKIQKYQNHPFFKAVGRFEGMGHSQMVLQSRKGYQQLYKDWLKLRKGIDFYNGATNIGTLQIWEIYELWCFLKMKRMVRKLLGYDPKKPNSEYGELIDEPSPLVYASNVKKAQYDITYHVPDPDSTALADGYPFAERLREQRGKQVVLHYQHTFNRKGGDEMQIRTFTTEQRPDIVMNILDEKGFTLTYLYDAKYRVWGDRSLDKDLEQADIEEMETLIREEGGDAKLRGADYPPSDAINQMHRYRDAIYYGMDESLRPESKEIIGGYILFPGRGDDASVGKRYFSKSIETVNIGAFPLLPRKTKGEDAWTEGTAEKDAECPQLWEHLKKTLLEKAEKLAHVGSSIPQKGLAYTQSTGKDGVALVMMENYEVRKLNFTRGKIAVPVKLTEDGMTLMEHQADIAFVLFHVRNKDTDKHLFKVKELVRILSTDNAQAEGYYVVQKTANRHICVEVDMEKELDSTECDPSKDNIPYVLGEDRYDSQFTTMKHLCRKEE